MKHGWFVLIAVICASIGAVVWLDEYLEPDEDFTLPIIEIYTDGGQQVETKSDYIGCTITISNSDTGDKVLGESGKIRGRGNSTWDQPSWWYMPKKPYKIKFDNEIDLFGNGKYAEWALIANYTDPSLSRDYFAYTIGSAIGLEDTTSVQCANLYLNGVYQGEYLVCEQIQITEGRVDIVDESNDGDYGFLIELDRWILNDEDAVEGIDYFSVDGATYAFKDTDDEDGRPSAERVESAKRYIESVEEAFSSGDYGKVCGLVDVESFALTYIVNELFHDKDEGVSSFYMYRTAGGKLVSGPIWDYDNSSGNSNDALCKRTDRLWAAEQNRWYGSLLQFDGFRSLVSERLSENEDIIRSAIDADYDYLMAHRHDFRQNFERWPTLGSHTGSNPLEFLVMDSWDDHVLYLKNWLTASLDHMVSVYCA